MTWSLTVEQYKPSKGRGRESKEKLAREKVHDDRKIERVLEDAHGEADALRKELARAQAERDNAPALSHTQRSAAKAEVKKVRAQMEGYKVELSKLEHNLAQSQQEQEEIASSLSTAQSDFDEASQPPELSPAHLALLAKVDSLAAELERARARVSELQQQFDQTQTQAMKAEALKNDLALEVGRGELFAEQARQGKIDVDDPQLEESRAAVEESTQQNIDAAKAKAVDLAGREAEFEEVARKLSMRHADIEKGNAKATELEEKVEQHKANINRNSDELDELEDELSLKRCSEGDVREMRGLLTGRQATHDGLLSSKSRGEKEVAQMASRAESAREELERSREDVQVLQAQVSSLKELGSKLVDETDKIDVDHSLDERQAEAKEGREKVAQLETAVKEVKARHDHLLIQQKIDQMRINTEQVAFRALRCDLADSRALEQLRKSRIDAAHTAFAKTEVTINALREKNEKELMQDEAKVASINAAVARARRSASQEKRREGTLDNAREERAAAKGAAIALEERVKEIEAQLRQEEYQAAIKFERAESSRKPPSRLTAATSVAGVSPLEAKVAIERLGTTLKGLNKLSHDVYGKVSQLRSENMELLIQIASCA